MALDRYDDRLDGARDVQPEQPHRRPGGSAGDSPAARPEPTAPAEPRTRAEYYEALRAADGQPIRDGNGDHDGNPRSRAGDDGSADTRAGDDGDAPADASGQAPADARQDRSGWDAVDPGKRPPLDSHHVTPERSAHILDGDSTGGGHRHGTGRANKTEFPASWDDQKTLGQAVDVARRPDSPPVHQQRNDRWLCVGTRDGVEVSVVVLRSGEVWTAWPEEGGPGVVRNPRKESS